MTHILDQPIATTGTRSPAAGPLLYRFEAQLELNVVGMGPDGLQMSNPFEGHVVEGIFEGARVWGIDPFLVRPDGLGVVDVAKTISGVGYHVLEHVRAYSYPPEGLDMPPLEALLEPDFVFPDLPFPIQGSSTFRAGTAEFAWLNGVVARVDGWANLATGALVIETRLMERLEPAQRQRSAGPVS